MSFKSILLQLVAIGWIWQGNLTISVLGLTSVAQLFWTMGCLAFMISCYEWRGK